jgi:hypothetical protein
MTGSSVLPVTIHRGKLLFLFGKENEFEDSAKGFSDFGGGVEKGENIKETALREGGEELTGFLGDNLRLKDHINKNGGTMKLSVNDYHVHIFYLEYDPKLPNYYNWNHQFLWKRMNKKMLSKTRLFEKIEIQWFTVPMMKARMKEFRPFYQNIVKHILSKKSAVQNFIKKCIRKTRRTFPSKRKTKKFRST